MTNILYIIWSLGLGGAEQVVINLARGLDKNKFRPFVCCLNDAGRFAEGLQKEGIPVFALNKVRGIDFSVVPKIVKIIKDNDIQIVHTHLWGANFWGRIAAKAAGVKVIATEHNIDEWKSRFHFLIDKWLFRNKTDQLVAVSSIVRDFYAKRLRVSKDRIKVIYNGISSVNECMSKRVNESKNLKLSFGIAEDEKVIAVIGRLVPQKGINFFLDAFKNLLFNADSRRLHADGRELNNNKVKALIVGEGPERRVLELRVQGVDELRDKVIFTGFRKDILEILRITDVLVLPSSREGLPMILLEAMAAGVIVVATRVGGTPELVQDGVNGFLVEYGDIDGLKNKLQQIINANNRESNADGRGLDEIRATAKKTVEEKFSLEKMVAEHQKIYESI